MRTTDEARQVIKESPISVIDAETVTSETGKQTAGATGQSRTGHEDQIQKNAHEVYGSRKRMVLFGIGGLVLGVGTIAILLEGFNEGWITLIAILGIPLFIGGGMVMFYQAIKHDPVLRITDRGINYNKPIVASEFYSWSNIEQISCVEQEVGKGVRGSTQVHLQIQVSELDDHNTASKVSNQLNKATLDDDSDAHYIPLSSFDVDFDEVAEAVKQYSDVPVTADV